MKLRKFLQAVAYSTAVLGTTLAGAADISYTDGEQRLRDLELRVDSLETFGNKGVNLVNGVSLAGYSGCDSSCGSGVACGSSCSRKSSWQRPCPTSRFDVEVLFFAASNSGAAVQHSQNDFNPGLRLTYDQVNECGRIFRVRYFNFGTTTEANFSRYELETIDTEIGRRFTLGSMRGEFTGGVRYAAFSERGFLDYDTTFGPLVGMQFRGRKFLNGTSFVSMRHSWQFGEASDNGALDAPGYFEISEVQVGLEWLHQSRFGTLVFRSALEAQSWSAPQDSDSENLGLYGTTSSVGLVF